MKYAFDGVTFEPGSLTVTSGKASCVLEPLSSDLLHYLLINRDRVVPKDELAKQLWAGRPITDSTITSRISVLRACLRQAGSTAVCIRTYARRGFRFTAPVTVAEMFTEFHVGTAPSSDPGGENCPAVISVMPFKTVSRVRAGEFAAGLHEDLLTAFSGGGWLTRAVVRMAGPNCCTEDDFRVDGSIRESGSALAVTARLVDARTGIIVSSWRTEVDPNGPRAEAFTAARIYSSLEHGLEKALDAHASGCRAAASADRLFLQGRRSMLGWTRRDIDSALQLFREAIALRPDFAAPRAMAAYCYVQKKSLGSIQDHAAAAKDSQLLALSAASIDPTDPTILATCAHALGSVGGDVEAAHAIASRAIESGPLSPLPLYVEGWLHLFAGNAKQAMAQLVAAEKLAGNHPLAFKIYGALSYANFFLGQYSEGARYGALALALHPDYLTGLRGRAANLAVMGERSRASGLIRHMRTLDPGLRSTHLGRLLPFRSVSYFDKWAMALRVAGLPD